MLARSQFRTCHSPNQRIQPRDGKEQKHSSECFFLAKYFAMIRIGTNLQSPESISVYTGNICNLACVLCGPEASSKWRAELGLGKESSVMVDESTVDLSNINHVTFGGGEPLLNKSTLALMQRLNSNVSLLIHLNGTVLPTAEFLNECTRFDQIIFSISIDDIKEQFEYLRWPAKWNDVVENVHWLVKNCPSNIKFAVNTVISSLNEHTYCRVANWVKTTLPSDTEWHTNESNAMLNRFEKLDSRDPVKYLDRIDGRRNTNWKITFPLFLV